MQLPQVIEVRGIRVLTTKQLAELYGTDPERIKLNYRYNKERYIVGKHIIPIEDAELREFKARYQFNTSFKYAKSLYLWTEKGALLHAKSLNTDKAWEVYEYLVDFYFRVKEETKPVPKSYRELREVALSEKKLVGKPPMMTVVDVPENPKILGAIKKLQDDLICMNVLLENLKKYTKEDDYIERRRVATEVVNFLVADCSVLLNLKPNIIEKRY